MTPNQAAFLAMIRHSEGTDRAADPYRVCYGFSHTIADLRDHPAITGEWMGESIASLGPQYIGKISTAAGAYQLIRPTWEGCKLRLGLPSFSAECQDDAALGLIKWRGGLAAIEAGDLQAAIASCAAEWASLPGSASGQPQAKLIALTQAYSQAGGQLA